MSRRGFAIRLPDERVVFEEDTESKRVERTGRREKEILTVKASQTTSMGGTTKVSDAEIWDEETARGCCRPFCCLTCVGRFVVSVWVDHPIPPLRDNESVCLVATMELATMDDCRITW